MRIHPNLPLACLIALCTGFGVYRFAHAWQPQPAIGNGPGTHFAKSVPSPVKLLFDESLLYGRFYFGDGLGKNCSLQIYENHRFDFAWHGCEGEYDRNYGSWSLIRDVVEMQ